MTVGPWVTAPCPAGTQQAPNIRAHERCSGRQDQAGMRCMLLKFAESNVSSRCRKARHMPTLAVARG